MRCVTRDSIATNAEAAVPAGLTFAFPPSHFRWLPQPARQSLAPKPGTTTSPAAA